MNIDDVKNICVVGAGNMGHQISLHCAIMGYNVTCTDISEEILGKAETFCGQIPARSRRQREDDPGAGR